MVQWTIITKGTTFSSFKDRRGKSDGKEGGRREGMTHRTGTRRESAIDHVVSSTLVSGDTQGQQLLTSAQNVISRSSAVDVALSQSPVVITDILRFRPQHLEEA